MKHALTTAVIAMTLAGCGFPPIINGARFLIVSEAGVDIAQLDFPDQRGCLTVRDTAIGGAARCQRRTKWNDLLVNADAELPDRRRVDAHFGTMSQCERQGVLSSLGATVVPPCIAAIPKR